MAASLASVREPPCRSRGADSTLSNPVNGLLESGIFLPSSKCISKELWVYNSQEALYGTRFFLLAQGKQDGRTGNASHR